MDRETEAQGEGSFQRSQSTLQAKQGPATRETTPFRISMGN